MIFPVISKFNAELVKKVEVAMQETMSNELFNFMASHSKGNSSDSLCLSWLSTSVTSLLVSSIKVVNQSMTPSLALSQVEAQQMQSLSSGSCKKSI